MGVAPTATAVVPNIHRSEICCQVASSGRKLSCEFAASKCSLSKRLSAKRLHTKCSKKLPTRRISGFVEKITHVGGIRVQEAAAGRRADRKAISGNYQLNTLTGNESIRSVESNSILETQRCSFDCCFIQYPPCFSNKDKKATK